MTIGNALTFIKRGMIEKALRDRLNAASTLQDLLQILDAEDLTFTPSEFEDAVNSSLVKCSECDEADELKDFQMWWEMLQQIISPETCASSGSCASAGSCASSTFCSSGCCEQRQ